MESIRLRTCSVVGAKICVSAAGFSARARAYIRERSYMRLPNAAVAQRHGRCTTASRCAGGTHMAQLGSKVARAGCLLSQPAALSCSASVSLALAIPGFRLAALQACSLHARPLPRRNTRRIPPFRPQLLRIPPLRQRHLSPSWTSSTPVTSSPPLNLAIPDCHDSSRS